MEIDHPAFWEPEDANPELDLSEEEDWEDEDDVEEEDGHQNDDQDEVRGQAPKALRYQIFQVVGTLVFSMSCTLAIYGVPSPAQEASLDSWGGSWDAVSALVRSQLQVRVFAVVLPILFLAFPEILGSLKRNACLLIVYAVLVAPFVLLPVLLPAPPCSGPDITRKPHPRRSSSLDSNIGGDASEALWTWVFWYGPVLLVSILSATKIYRTRDLEAPMALQVPQQPQPPAHEDTGLWLDRRRG